ncbi:hypothetical protein [Vibrio splendidus]|uniref:hypothetical protein n=1 Tax=Vibrio splendidus TaxID=29497 RepID=UPI001FB47CF5|nr:hypothetical protein [Vibrio splendidus]UOE86914.1 hypothetical protein LTQ54_16970 [Vibrio splendidus]UOE91765.1 hypothetical protein LTQ02_19285 [Vibrio splendidus]
MIKGNVDFETTCHESGFKKIAFINGKLYIDNKPIRSVVHDQKVCWVQTINSKEQIGYIDLSPIKSKAKASLHNGGIYFNDVKHKFVVNSYCNYSINIEGEDTPWHDFNFCWESDENGDHNEVGYLGNIEPENNSLELKNSTEIVFTTVDSNDVDGWGHPHMSSVLCAEIQLSNIYCELKNDKKYAIIYFSPDYMNITGFISEYKFDSPDQIGKRKKVSGEYKDFVQEIPSTENTELLSESSQSSLISSVNLLFSSIEDESEPELTVGSLYDLDTPEPSQVQHTSFNRVTNLIKYSSKEAQILFGITPPSVGTGRDLTQADVDLLKEPKTSEFFDKKLSVAYVSEALHASTDKTISNAYKPLDNFDSKMGYFWSGDGATSLSKSTEFNTLISKINDEVFLEKTKGLQAYKEDTRNWAEELYNKCCFPPVLAGLCKNKEQLSALCSKLHALDPTIQFVDDENKNVSYATALKNRVLKRQLTAQFEKVVNSDEYEIAQFLISYMEAFFDDLLTGDSWQGPLRDHAIKELKELQLEYKFDSMEEFVARLSDDLPNYMSLFARCLVEANGGTTLAKINDAQRNFFNRLDRGKWPERGIGKLLKKVPQLFVAATTVFSILKITECFLDFDRLTDMEKVELISGTVVLSGTLFAEGAAWTAATRISSMEAKLNDVLEAGVVINNEMQAAKINHIIDVFAIEDGIIEIPGALVGAEYASETYKSATRTAASVERWQKVANISKTAIKVVGIAALSFGCFMAGMACYHDFVNGQPLVVKVFDIMQACTDTLCLVIEITSFFVEIPLLGAVVAVAGILVTLVNLFIPRKKPLTPVEVYIRDTSIPFVESLDMPTEEWLDKNNSNNKESTLMERSLVLA